MNRVIETLKSFYGIAAGIGVVIPGFSFFSNYAPPLFKGIAILSIALSVAAIVIIVNSESKKKNVKHYTFSAIKYLAASFVLTLLYMFLMDFTTIVPREFPEERWQTGFDLQPWSLTPEANKLVLDKLCSKNKETLLSCASMQKENILLLWTPLSVYGAGLILILLFTVSSLFWSIGWSLLAKSHILKNNITS